MQSSPNVIRGYNVDSCYLELIKHTLWYGDTLDYKNNVGSGKVQELRPTTVIFPGTSKYITVRKKFNLAFALAEVLWILQGRDDVEMLVNYNKNIAKYSDDGKVFNASYGKRIFGINGDQFYQAYRKLKENPDTRQAYITIAHPPDDNKDGCKDYACNRECLLKIRHGKLEWTQIVRSNDVIWGVPYNFVQFISLQQIMASLLGVPIGNYTHFSDSTHIYDYSREDAEKAKDTENTFYNSPPIAFNCENYDQFRQWVSYLSDIEMMTRVSEDADVYSTIDSIVDIGVKNWIATLAFYNKAVVYKNLEEAKRYLTLLSDNSYEQQWCLRKLEKLEKSNDISG